MGKFSLHPRLTQDTIHLRDVEFAQLLLMNNSLYHWFIIVPTTEITEWYQLSEQQQFSLNKLINLLSLAIKERLNADKLNIALIGNVVEQMHIHVIGRNRSDVAWPNVVWGREERQSYEPPQIEKIRHMVNKLF
ncbi:MAG: HIT family protein [Gammaproteobacteria bacterium]|nr:HIT family protein [Gammaproteobacteria bacterium]